MSVNGRVEQPEHIGINATDRRNLNKNSGPNLATKKKKNVMLAFLNVYEAFANNIDFKKMIYLAPECCTNGEVVLEINKLEANFHVFPSNCEIQDFLALFTFSNTFTFS